METFCDFDLLMYAWYINCCLHVTIFVLIKDKKKIYIYILLYISGASERISSKTYVIVSGNVACIRRLNGTHQVGCSCKFLGNALISIT